jgi:small subunit ribosomal protein S16
MGVDVLDLAPPPESSPTVGGGSYFFGSIGVQDYSTIGLRDNEEEVIKTDMAVSMRLMRYGGKKSPYYRIVIADRRTSRDGGFIEQIGTYDPKKDPVEVRFKEEKAIQWLRKGAQPTPTVRQLLIQSGVSKKLAEGKVG